MPEYPKGYRHSRGEAFEGFELLEPLGRGGNAEVWRAARPDLGEIALKIINARKPASEQFRRFAREVAVQRELSGEPGILPVLDANVPEDGKGQPWLAMPVATSLSDPDLQGDVRKTVEQIASIAATLARMHDAGRAHRDIKPSNLYVYGGQPVVGDFGLVDDPDGAPITEEAGILGPRHYVAWEVLDDPHADWRKADVYALAKTLWVLLTRMRYPQPGEHQPGPVLSRVGSYTPHPLAERLDVILAAATRLAPETRVSAREMSASLRAVLAEPVSIEAAPINEEALARLAGFLRPGHDARSRTEEYLKRIDDVLAVVEPAIQPMYDRLDMLATIETQLAISALLGWRTETAEIDNPGVLETLDRGYTAEGPDRGYGWS